MILELGALTIKFDVLIVQLINIGIIFWLFKRFVGDTLTKEITKRRELMKKLKDTDHEYKAIISDAEKKKQDILHEAYQEKNSIINEAKSIAQKSRDAILDTAKKEAESVIASAKDQGTRIEKSIIEQWQENLKHSAAMIVKKLIGSDIDLQSRYLNTLVDEASDAIKK